MILWRGFECAAYKHFSLSEPVLDIGCGDGAFFRFLWPEAREVRGVEASQATAAAAMSSGVYRDVHIGPAHEMRFGGQPFASAFANCSLEHMDRLPEVLRRTSESLRSDGRFLMSVVTEKLLEWCPLPLLSTALGQQERAAALRSEYICYHHLTNALPVVRWVSAIQLAGFEVVQYIPLMPELCSRVFLLFDELWHVREGNDELGEDLFHYFRSFPRLSGVLPDLISTIYTAEEQPSIGSGAVFYAVKT